MDIEVFFEEKMKVNARMIFRISIDLQSSM